MPIALLCAIPPEWDHIRDAMTAPTPEAGVPFGCVRGTLEGHDVVLAEAGIGKVNTAVVASLLVERFGVRTILLSGVAGGVDPGLGIGDVVVGTRAVQHDAGVASSGEFSPYQAGHVPFFNPTDEFGFECSSHLAAAAERAFSAVELEPLSARAGGTGRTPKIAYGTVASGDQYIGCEKRRAEIHARFGALAVEMEGGALGQACRVLGVDWLNIRALSDLAGSTSQMDFHAFVHEVAASSALLLRRLVAAM